AKKSLPRFQQPPNEVFATPGPRRGWRSVRPVGYARPMRRPFSAILLILAGCQGAAADFPARVVGISDGDTLTVLTADRRQVKVRLHGTAAPETGQDFGSRAKQAASELAFGKQVTVRERDKDRYGRTVAEVILPDGHSLNR